MIENEDQIVDWLRGREELPQPGFPSPGLAALVGRLRSGEPLGERVSNELAKALEHIGGSPMVLRLEHRGCGRPRNDVRRAYEDLKLGAEIENEFAAQDASGGRKPKLDLVVEEAAKRSGKSRSPAYAASKIFRWAKGLSD